MAVIEYLNGFYDEETDGIRSFRWMRNLAAVKFHNCQHECYLHLLIGNPSPQSQRLTIVGKQTKELILPPGWSEHNLLLSEFIQKCSSEITLQCPHTLDVDGDMRTLSLMIHADTVEHMPSHSECGAKTSAISSTLALLDGWYGEEQENNRIWCWTGSYFTISANNSGNFIKILCSAVLDVRPGAVNIHEDYATIVGRNMRTGDNQKKHFVDARQIVVFEIPVQKGDVLSFLVNPVFKPHQDDRELGIQVEKIEIVEQYSDISFTEHFLVPCDSVCDYTATLSPDHTKKHPIDVSKLKLVFAFYYIWYNNPRVSGYWRHWDGKNLSDGVADNIFNHPLLGLYDSSDTGIIKKHINFAENAGIDSFIISWWNDKRDIPALQNLGRQLESSAIKLAFHIEYNAIRDCNSIESVAECLWDILKLIPDSALLKIDDRPVFFIHILTLSIIPAIYWERIKSIIYDRYDTYPIILCDENSDLNNMLVDGTYSYNFAWDRRIGSNLNIFKKSWLKALPQTYEKVDGFCDNLVRIYSNFYKNQIGASRELRAVSTMTVFPGFNDIFLYNGYGIEFDRCQGKLLREQWEAVIEEQPNFVLINSWNEWHEGTDIEPNATDGDLYLEITKKGIRKYKYSHSESKSSIFHERRKNTGKKAFAFPQRIPATRGVPFPGCTDLSVFFEYGYTLIYPPVSNFIAELDSATQGDILIFPGDQFFLASSAYRFDILESVMNFLKKGGTFYVLGHVGWPMLSEVNVSRDINYTDARIDSGGTIHVDFLSRIGIQLENKEITPEEFTYNDLVFKSETHVNMPTIKWSLEFTANWYPAEQTTAEIEIASFEKLLTLFHGANDLGAAVVRVAYHSGGVCCYVNPELVRCRNRGILEGIIKSHGV